MRYFKYDGPHPDNAGHKAQYAALTADEKRRYRKAEFLGKIGTITFFVVAAAVFGGLVWLIWLIPEPEMIVLEILNVLVEVVLYLLAVIVSGVIGALVALPLWSKQDAHAHAAKRQLLAKACDYLRQYYQLQEPCLVTKCYDCGDKRFIDHDVCLFFAEGELRITTNLQHGFFHGDKDLGCYAFGRDEVTFRTVSHEGLVATELTGGGMHFLLGRRAQSFLKKHVLLKAASYQNFS